MFLPCQTMTAYAWKPRKLDTNVCHSPKARRGRCFQKDRPGGVEWHAQMSLSSYCIHRPCLTAGGVSALWGGRGLRGELRQITTILLLLCTAAAFWGHSYGEQIMLVITWAVLWSLEMCYCAHPGGILSRFPWCHGSTWSRCSSLVHTTAMGEKHITSELPAFRQYRVTGYLVPLQVCGVYQKNPGTMTLGWLWKHQRLAVTLCAWQAGQVTKPVLWQPHFHPSLSWGPQQLRLGPQTKRCLKASALIYPGEWPRSRK